RLPILWNTFCAKLRGHTRYYGVSFNGAHVRKFLHSATRILWKWLNRRSQRRSMTWDQFHRFLQTHPLPRAKMEYVRNTCNFSLQGLIHACQRAFLVLKVLVVSPYPTRIAQIV